MILPDFVQDEPRMGLFESLHIGEDALVPYDACRRCRRANLTVVRVEICYPGTVRFFECCPECRDAIMDVMDKAMKEAGI